MKKFFYFFKKSPFIRLVCCLLFIYVNNSQYTIYILDYNARSASNMIPCFPTNNSTDVHHCDIVSSRSSPSHFTKSTPFKNKIYIMF